jgi:MFS family permease
MNQAAPFEKAPAPAPKDAERGPIPGLVVGLGFLLITMSYVINAMDRQVFYPLLPTIRDEYGFPLQQAGLLATIFTLGMAFGALPSGYLVDRFSRKTVLVTSIAIYSLGTLVTPLASGFADMVVYRIVSGVGEGMQTTALFAIVGTYFHRRRALALGCMGVAFGVGNFLGPVIGIQLASTQGTWRAPFLAFGIAGLAIAVLIAGTVSRRLTERLAGPTVAAETYDHLPASAYNRNTIALAVTAALFGLVVYGFLGLYPTFLTTELHYTPAEAALAVSFIGIGGVTALFGGWLGDRVNLRTLLITSQLALSLTSLLVYQTTLSVGWQCLFAFLMGACGIGFFLPNVNSAVQKSVRPEQVGRAQGLGISCVFGAAAFSGLLFGALVDQLGWRQAALWQITLLPLFAVVALAFVRTSQFSKDS